LKLLSEEENAYIHLLEGKKWVYSVNGEPKKVFKQISIDHSRNEVIVQDQETKEYRKLTGKRDYVGKSLDQMHETNLLTKWQAVWKASIDLETKQPVKNLFYRISDSIWVEKFEQFKSIKFKFKFISYDKFEDKLILYDIDRNTYFEIDCNGLCWGIDTKDINNPIYKGCWLLPLETELFEIF
jgi:hypothetical protein